MYTVSVFAGLIVLDKYTDCVINHYHLNTGEAWEQIYQLTFRKPWQRRDNQYHIFVFIMCNSLHYLLITVIVILAKLQPYFFEI